MRWRFPVQEDVVMDFLEDTLDQDRVWVGSWHPLDDDCDPYEGVVLVTNEGHSTVDETRWGTVEILVEADTRAVAKQLAFDIVSALNALPGKDVRGVLVDDVVENDGPAYVGNEDKSRRTYRMIYTLAFRKQPFEE